uniref:Cell cycle checkpoint protein RAD1 n=1 Tax=Lingulaulax polyedra TaxID=160621 RepID=A0A516AGF3_LINPO|nr:cell cycle checkpoint protein RAD1 [Lingulodinium polyedra]
MAPAAEGEAAAAGAVECRLESAHDLAVLLAALQLREREQREQRVHCEASGRGLKFMAQSNAKDVAVLGWMFSNAFREYRYTGGQEELHLRLPVAPLLSCLQILSDRAVMTLRYPSGPSDELRFTLEEDGATTECRLRTLVLEEAPAPIGSFFAPGDPLSMFRPAQAEAWHLALSEFAEFDAPDVVLRITLRAAAAPSEPAVVLCAQTLASDAEVELPRAALEDLELAPEAAASGEATHCYQLAGVLASCLRAAKDAKAVKVRFNSEGVMSNQFILRGRGQRDLFCEALVSPLAESRGAARGTTGGAAPDNTPAKRKPYAAGESLGF